MDDYHVPVYQRYAFTLAQVQERSIDYIWDGRMAAGMLTLIDGDPGNGKTLLAMDIAARLTRGEPLPFSDHRQAPASVLVFSAEDSLEQVIKPRMMAANADPHRVGFVVMRHPDPENTSQIPLSIPANLHDIKAVAMAMENTRMILIDPIMAYLGAEISSADDMQVRQALAPLVALAEEVQCAVVMIRHLNKNQGASSMYRGGGSIAFIGASRFSFVSGRYPDDPTGEVRVLAPNKINANKNPLALTYTIQHNEEYRQPVIQWGSEAELHAEQLVLEGKSIAEMNKIQDAMAWLRSAMSSGSVPTGELKKRASADNFSWAEVLDAIDADGVRRKENALTHVWEYYYPEKRLREIVAAEGFIGQDQYE